MFSSLSNQEAYKVHTAVQTQCGEINTKKHDIVDSDAESISCPADFLSPLLDLENVRLALKYLLAVLSTSYVNSSFICPMSKQTFLRKQG